MTNNQDNFIVGDAEDISDNSKKSEKEEVSAIEKTVNLNYKVSPSSLDCLVSEIIEDSKLARTQRKKFGFCAFVCIFGYVIVVALILIGSFILKIRGYYYSFWSFSDSVLITLIIGVNACLVATVFVMGKVISHTSRDEKDISFISKLAGVVSQVIKQQ